MKKLYIFSNVFILAGLISCSSEPKRTETADSTNPITATADPATLKPFEPDKNWTSPTVVVSQYGPPGIIRDVVIDQNGIIWMAAWDGVVCYDPQTKQFTNHTLKNGLSHHRVYSVMKDSKGNMWFGTMGAGAYKYDGNTFTNYSTNNGMGHNVVFDLFEDSGGNIWFATTTGASMYNGKSFMNLDSTSELKQEVYAISEDRNGIIWLGGAGGLFQYDPARPGKVAEVMTEFDTHYANVRDLLWHNGAMYAGCSRGLYKCSETDNYPSQLVAINDKFTGYIHPDHSGNLLLTTKSLYRFNPATSGADDTSARYATIVEDIATNSIFGARETEDGTIWYGAGDGLHSVKNGKDVSYKNSNVRINVIIPQIQ